jgi:4-amino-4-deoxy-L-arabinose transferase-like glycosyltransferase
MDVSQVAEAAPAARAGHPPPAGRRRVDSAALSGLTVLLLTVVGAAVRVAVAHQSLFADELSTYWIVTTHDLGGVLSTVHSNAEITPPLYFVASWIGAQISHAPELIRAPSLIAGTATIPLVYLLGMRTVGRAAALVATALVTAAPFMVYYSTEARGYGVMMALTVLSTLAMLTAVDRGGARWWALYGVASAGAAYSHYTCVFVLAAQLGWLLLAHPEARRPALLANVGAGILYLPWITGLVKDFTSPTGKILSALSPFDAHTIRIVAEHWSIGYPYSSVAGLRELPGTPALVLLAVGLVLAVAGALAAIRSRRPAMTRRADQRLLLVLLLFLSVPAAEAAISAVTTHLFAVRNLAAAWPPFALLLGALLAAAGPRLRYVAALLVVAALAIGAVKMLEQRYSRPDYRAAAHFVERTAGPRDVVVDGTGVLSPGPLSGLDAVTSLPQRTFRAGAPQEREHPFGLADPNVPSRRAIARAVAAAGGHSILMVELIPPTPGQSPRETVRSLMARSGTPPAPYRLVDSRIYPGIVYLSVQTYERR